MSVITLAFTHSTNINRHRLCVSQCARPWKDREARPSLLASPAGDREAAIPLLLSFLQVALAEEKRDIQAHLR